MPSNKPWNNEQAHREGWGLFWADGKELQLQRLDEAEIFTSDHEAMRYVRDRAGAGSAYHEEAIRRVYRTNPAEYQTIMTC